MNVKLNSVCVFISENVCLFLTVVYAWYSEFLEVRSSCDNIYLWVTVVNYCHKELHHRYCNSPRS